MSVSYSGNTIIFSGAASSYSLVGTSTSDYSVSGNNTNHTFFVSKGQNSTVLGDISFSNDATIQTIVFKEGLYEITSITCTGSGKTLIIGNNAKLKIGTLIGPSSTIAFTIRLDQDSELNVTGDAIGASTIILGTNEFSYPQDNANINFGGAINNHNVSIVGTNCIYTGSNCVNLTIDGIAAIVNGGNNNVTIGASARKTQINGASNTITDSGVGTIIVENNEAPVSAQFGNIIIEGNEIRNNVTNGGVTFVPNGTGEVTLAPGASISSASAIITKNYLETNVTRDFIGLGNVENIKNNYNAIVSPTANDDASDGYSIGSYWVNVVTDTAFVCTDTSLGASVWKEITNTINVGDVTGAMNLGVGGVGLFANKTNGILNFYSIAPATNRINVVLSGNNVTIDANEMGIDHNNLLNYEASRHVNHNDVSIIAGAGLSGGGTIATSRTITLDVNNLTTIGTANSTADFIPIYSAAGSTTRKIAAGLVGIQTHSALGGLSVDDHSIYALLAGRGTGQILYGGTAAGATLTLAGTSNVTPGAVLIPSGIASNGIGTGSLVVTGGIGVSGAINSNTGTFGNVTISGNSLSSSTGEIVVTADPITPFGIATKGYVDASRAGIDPKDACRVMTTVLASFTPSGNVLTASANGALGALDGINVDVGDRILYNTLSANAFNGIYVVTSLGSASTRWVLTRSTDANSSAAVTNGMYTFIAAGNVYAGFGYFLTTPDPITLNTTPLTFTQFSAGAVYSAANATGTGIGTYNSTSGTQFLFNRIASSGSINAALVGNDITLTTIDSGINHNSLAGLGTGDPHSQYPLLVGRGSGQTLSGGTTSGNLFLRSNQANNAGQVLFESNVGLQGRILYGTTTANGRLVLQGNSNDTNGGVTIQSITAGGINSGALIVLGGGSFSGGLFIGNNLSFSGTVITSTSTLALTASGTTSVTNNTASSSATTGALVVTGGIGCNGTSFFGGVINIINGTASTGSNNGALVVSGGIGCAGNSFFSGLLRVSNTTASTSGTTGALVVSGGIGCSGNSFFSGVTTISNTTASTAANNGALVVSGGIGCAGNSFFSGAVNITLNTASSSPTSGALIVTGGIGCNGTSFFGGVVNIINGTASSGSNNGALVVSGGIGCAGNSFFSGITTISNTTASTASNNGALVVAGGIGCNGLIVTQNGISGANGILTLRGSANDLTGRVNIISTEAATSPGSGGLLVAGGVGCAGIYSSGTIFCNNLTATSATITSPSQWTFTNATNVSGSTAAIVASGGILAAGDIMSQGSLISATLKANVGSAGTITIPSNELSISPTTGALVVTGGIGCSSNVTFGNNLTFSSSSLSEIRAPNGGLSIGSNGTLTLRANGTNTTGTVTILGTSNSTASNNGAFTVAGGIGISGNSTFSGVVTVSNNTNATSNSTGAVIVSGGLGVSGTSYIGNIIINSATISSPSTLTLSGNGLQLTSTTGVITSGTLTINNGSAATISTSGASLGITGGSSGLFLFGGNNGGLVLQSNSTTTASGIVNVAGTLGATSATNAAFTVSGGVGIGESLIVSNCQISTGTNTIISTISNNGNITFAPNGSGQVLCNVTPTTATSVTNKTYVDGLSYLTLTGEVTSVGAAVTLVNSAVLSKVLTGFVSGSGDLANTDTILGALQKLDGKLSGNGVSGRVPIYSGTKTFTNDANLTFSSGTSSSTLTINSTSGDGATISGNRELILQQTGDQFGTSRLLIRNRTGENGIIVECLSLQVSDLIVKNSIAQRNIRVESRSGSGAGSARAGVTSMHLGGTNPDNPTLAIGDNYMNTTPSASLCIGGYIVPSSKIHVTDSSTGTSAIRFTNSTTGATSTDGLEIGYATNAFINNREATDLTIATGGITRMTITSAGAILLGSAPSDDSSAVTKLYTDSLPGKRACRVRSTGLTGTASGPAGPGRTITANPAAAMPQIDGITLVPGDRIFYDVNSSLSGIYNVTQTTSPWTIVRSTDADTAAKLACGTEIYVEQGTVNAARVYRLVTNNPITIDTTSLTFTQQLTSASGIVHSSLSGLLQDDHTIYALLAGRGTSQTLSGGTSANGSLVLRGNATDLTGFVSIASTTASTSGATGALIVAGGVGIAQGCNIARTGAGTIGINNAVNQITNTSNLTITSPASTYTSSNGNTIVSATNGNVTISPSNNLIVSGNITINNNTNVISTSTGDITFAPIGKVLTNGIPLANNGVATKEYVGFGGTIRVDAIFGNDATGAKNGGAFLTITAAIAAATSGDVIMLFPGTYALSTGITLNNVSIVGFSASATTLLFTPTSNAIGVSLNSGAKLESVIIQMSSSSAIDITGVSINASSCVVKNCAININSTSTATVAIIGVSGTNAVNTFANNVISTEINVISSSTGRRSAIYAPSNTIIRLAQTSITSNGIGAESDGGIIGLCNCVVSGAVADVSQNSGEINLYNGTLLVNNSTNELSITPLNGSNKLLFGDAGTLANGNNWFYFIDGAQPNAQVFHTIQQGTAFYLMQIDARVAGSGTITITVNRNGVATLLTGQLINSTSLTINSVGVSFAPGDRISVSVNRSGTSPTDTLVSLYSY